MFQRSLTALRRLPSQICALNHLLSVPQLQVRLNLVHKATMAGVHNNLLGEERSPYLLQHAQNPVHWYPWGEAAFQAAREGNKLIFLSVGYSTCHWCHVMERESFENDEVAEIMNQHFINVKVDREERPDVDKVYMSFVQATNGGGGWPMSVFLTPTLKPIYGGTYFPPEDSMFGRPGFKTVLRALAGKWDNQAELLVESGDKIIEAMSKSNIATDRAQSVPEIEPIIQTCFQQLLKSYDSEMGGFSKAPKFPQPVNFNFLFTLFAARPNDDKAKQGLKMVLHTLEMMAKGGIHDHVSQGFARYSTDANWHVPHFEKMLYDQAQLSYSYSQAFQATKEPRFSTTVDDILTYVSRDLGHPLGAFYSAEDADSLANLDDLGHKKEGAFCVWNYQELTNVLKEKTFTDCKGQSQNLLDVCVAFFNVKASGNVDPSGDPHGELKGQNVLTTIGTDKARIIEDFGLENEIGLSEKIQQIQQLLYTERQKRPRPHLDDKILTSWNGLMISGFATAGMALQRTDFVDKASRAAAFLKANMYVEGEGTLLRSAYTGDEGQVLQLRQPIHGFVDDYAFLIRGLIDLYEATFEPEWLEWAEQLQEKQNSLFWDEKGHGYFTAPEGDESIVLRLKEDQDGAEPSANSVSSLNLLRLAAFFDNADYKDRAAKLIASYKETLERFPVALPEMTCGLMMLKNTPVQIIISGSGSDKSSSKLVEACRTNLLPQKVLIYADGNKDSILYKKLDILKDIPTGQADEKAYICQNYACSEPVSTPEQLLKIVLKEIE